MLTVNEIGKKVQRNNSNLVGVLEEIRISKRYGASAVISFVDENGQSDILFSQDPELWSEVQDEAQADIELIDEVEATERKLWYKHNMTGEYGYLIEKKRIVSIGYPTHTQIVFQTCLGKEVVHLDDWSNVAEPQPKMLCEFSDSHIDAQAFYEKGNMIDYMFYFSLGAIDGFDGEGAWEEYQAINNPEPNNQDSVDDEDWKFSAAHQFLRKNHNLF